VVYGPAQTYPPQPGVPTGGAGASVPWMNPDWLAASTDRERAVGVLRAGFAEGRLSQDELDDRVGRAYSARTYGELWAVTADLPAGPFVAAHGPVAVLADRSPTPASWRPAAALIITALVIFTLAALITAIVTQHAQPVPFQRVSVPVPYQQVIIVPPGEQQAVLTPYYVVPPLEWNMHSEFGGLDAPPPGP
jgi:hypothetical protein